MSWFKSKEQRREENRKHLQEDIQGDIDYIMQMIARKKAELKACIAILEADCASSVEFSRQMIRVCGDLAVYEERLAIFTREKEEC